MKNRYLNQIIIIKTVFGSVRNIEENISGKKRIVLQSLKTIEKCKKLQNNTELSVKNMIFSNVADLRSSGYSKLAELLLVNFLKMNSFRRSEDHLDYE